jgi:neutral ceramidase
MNKGPLRAGVSEVELKPPLGLATGDGAPFAKGYLTPLYVKALVLSNGHDEVAVVTLDMLGIDRADALRAAGMVQERCGVPAQGVIMTCSHTHVAPSMLPTLHTYRETINPLFDEEAKRRERDWVDQVVRTVADAVSAAKGRLQEASIGVTTADLPWLVFNRRRYTRNYGVWTHWMGIPQDQAHGVEGPIDPDFGLFVVRGADYHPVCLLWNFTGHNSFNFGERYSADLAYTVQAALDERIGEHIPCLYAPGCSGNTNYFDYQKPEGLQKATEGVASTIMAIYREACTLPDVKLGSRQAELYLAQRDVSRYWWKADIEAKLPGWIGYGPKEVARFQAEIAENETYPFDVTVLRMGEAALVGVPAEAFVEFGLMIKERSPFRYTYVASYANGYAGYVATRRAFMGGSYEVWPTLNARVAREGGYLMVDKAVELLEELAGQAATDANE